MKYFLDFRENIPENFEELVEEYDITGIFTNSPNTTFENNFVVEDEYITREGKTIGKILPIQTPEDMQKAMKMEIDKNLEIVVIETGDWHIIPIENLIAKFNATDQELIASGRSPEEIQLLGSILELGVDGCLLQANNRYDLDELLEATKLEETQLELQELEVLSIERIGNGDRVCVDTCSILYPGEGLLVGSTSAVQVLVQAEVEESGFVNSRPFRINAGVVASYVLNFDKTNYLSELEAGKSIMVVNKKGVVRKEQIARVKIERRPLILLKVKYNERTYPVILQDAETVKLVQPNGVKRIDKLEEGDRILGYVSDKGRHFGMEIDEFIEER